MAENKQRIGWVGMGRMGYPMAERLLAAGYDVSIWNRTKSKAEPLAQKGGKIVDRLSDLAGMDVVFSIVSTGKDVEQVYFGKDGVLSGNKAPAIFVDCSTIAVEESAAIRQQLKALGADFVAACVSMFGFAEGRAPDALLIAAQVFMGTSLGTQFRREFLGRLLPIMLAGTVVILFTTSANALVGVGLAYVLGLPIATMVLATAPGGMAEMVVTAKLLGLDATLITGFQLLRIVLVLAWTRPAYHLLEWLSGKNSARP